jgi:hypothetical protein
VFVSRIKEEQTEGVKEMLGNKSDEGTERWRKLCNENVYCTTTTAKMTTSGTGLYIQNCARQREEKHNVEDLVIEGRHNYIHVDF